MQTKIISVSQYLHVGLSTDLQDGPASNGIIAVMEDMCPFLHTFAMRYDFATEVKHHT